MKDYEPKRNFVVTVKDLCPCCNKLQENVRKHDRYNHGALPAGRKNIIACDDCFNLDTKERKGYIVKKPEEEFKGVCWC
jgi:hypothetical protein